MYTHIYIYIYTHIYIYIYMCRRSALLAKHAFAPVYRPCGPTRGANTRFLLNTLAWVLKLSIPKGHGSDE